jgi:hypothetical protein
VFRCISRDNVLHAAFVRRAKISARPELKTVLPLPEQSLRRLTRRDCLHKSVNPDRSPKAGAPSDLPDSLRGALPPAAPANPFDQGQNPGPQQSQKESVQMNRMMKVALFCCLSTLPMMAADISGKWTYEDRGGVQVWGRTNAAQMHQAETIVIDLKADGNALNGTMTFPRTGARNVPNTKRISNGKIDGDNLSFDLVSMLYGTQLTTHYFGKVDGDTIHFMRKASSGDSQGSKFDAHRAATP